MMYILIFIIILLSAFLIWLAFRYEKIAKELKVVKEMLEESKTKTNDEVRKLIDKAARKSQNILAALDIANESVKKEFGKELSSASQELVLVYRQKLAETIEKEAIAEVRNFRELLGRETVDLQKIVEGKVEEEYKTMEKELVVYRAEKLKKIDEKIYEILLAVSKVAFGKALTNEQQGELIFDALEKAKKEGMFKWIS